MFLIATIKARIRQIDTACEIIVEIFVVSNGVVFPRRIHHFSSSGIIFAVNKKVRFFFSVTYRIYCLLYDVTYYT